MAENEFLKKNKNKKLENNVLKDIALKDNKDQEAKAIAMLPLTA